ncbi:glutamate 5-kinase [Citromicrobium bathyomarinum]|uniref:glutamate 5-kinase n=1 Tax=Citromicrobium bathyomarinum TaxID=72174 RepID=UPI001E633317|nr:glutamate 5-kinase [Citromicrobium bathyomarinum]MCD1623003.1 glutamate 5-kinase [Citromicrobium bathyomarinum]
MTSADSSVAASLAQARRIVVKVGSSLMIDPESRTARTAWLATLAQDIAALRAGGAQVIVVSSGAVALGWKRLGIERSPQLDRRQAAAAVGQGLLMNAWSAAFATQGITVGQLLLTYDDSESPQRSANARATLGVLLDAGAVPVVNENDSVATEELKLGDNDRLSARVAELADADLLLLSDVDGLYDRDPADPVARHIAYVPRIDEGIAAMAGGTRHEGVGTGGMATKIAAARHATGQGRATIIASGRSDHPVSGLREGARATLFDPAKS